VLESVYLKIVPLRTDDLSDNNDSKDVMVANAWVDFLADCTARSAIGSWHHNVVCPSVRLSVCPSVTPCIVALRVGIDG